MPEVIAMEDIVRVTVGGLACLALLYGADRAIVFHAALFRAQFSGDKPDRFFARRPKVLTGPVKLVALVLTTVGFCATILTHGKSPMSITVTIVGFLTFMGMSLFSTLRELRK